MVGESGSGKSTIARAMVAADTYKATVRVNRDSFRKMLFEKWNAKYEKLVESLEFESAATALGAGFNVIVDDLNINPKTRKQWEDFAKHLGAEFALHEVNTPLHDCVLRDRMRKGRDRVGQSIITKQFIRNGRPGVFENRPTILVDVDGTLANNEPHRSPYDESRVYEDGVHENIANMVRKAATENQIIIVSGRHEDCGPDTEDWLIQKANVPYNGLLMRNRGDNRSDIIVKQELLDMILKYVDKENLVRVLDDRPRVIRMWRKNGLEVFAARGEDVEDF